MAEEGTRLHIAKNGHVTIATLTGPLRQNLMTDQSLLDIEAFALSMRDDTECRVVIFASDQPHFCCGLHLSALMEKKQQEAPIIGLRRQLEYGKRMMTAVSAIPQVTIAAVNGVAAGGGACLAFACDFRVAADTAQLGLPEVKRGLNLSWNALPVITRLAGPARAKTLIMGGEMHDAGKLEQWGLIDNVCPEQDLADQSMAMAHQYAALPPIPAQMIKASVNAVSAAMDPAIMHMDADQFLLAAMSNDCEEAILAFLQKRDPVFSGN